LFCLPGGGLTKGYFDLAPNYSFTGSDGTVAVMRGLRDFQEHLGGELTVTLLDGIGLGIEVHEIDEALMERSIAWLKSREVD